MNKVATNILDTLSKTEQGDATKQTPLAPLQTLKPEPKAPAQNHSNILDSLLQAINPKPAEQAQPAAPVVESPAPGVAPKTAKASAVDAPAVEAPATEAPAPSMELLSEEAHAAVKEYIAAATKAGKSPEEVLAEISDFAKEQTGENVIPSDAQLKGLGKEQMLSSFDEEEQKANMAEEGKEGFHLEEKKTMDGLSSIAARILTLGATAGENPFAKKDDKDEKPADDKKEDKGDNKANPFAKKDDKDEKPADDKKEDKGDNKANPFEKKDDKPEEKKDDKPAEKKEDKPAEKKEEHKSEEKKDEEPKKSKSEKKSEKDDLKALKEALKIMEKFLTKEEKSGEAGPEAEIAKEVVEGIKELAGEEVKEKAEGLDLGAPMEIGVEGPVEPIEKAGEEPKDMFGAPETDLAKDVTDTMKPGAPMPGAMKPIPTIKPNLALAKFDVNDRVLSRSAEASDEDPGKIIAVCANNKYIVDWGTEIPTEEDGRGLMKIEVAAVNLFNNAPTEEIAAVQPEGGQMANFDNEETKVLSNMSFADALTRMNEDYDDDCEVMHIGSGLKGKIVSSANNRLVVDFGGKQSEYWPHEVKLFSRDL